VTLPTGGSISYTYRNGTGTGTDPINCTDGTAMALTRVVSPGGTWKYDRALVSGSHWPTTVTDPMTPSNQTVYDMAQDSGTKNFYEVQRHVYQGSTSGTLLNTTMTCYNGAAPPCTLATSSITRRTIYNYLPDTSGPESETDVQYFSGLPIESERDTYNFGTPGHVGSLTQKVLTTLLFMGSFNLPHTITVQDGSGVTKSLTTYSYDQTAVTTTTGTPNHISAGSARGNATEIDTQVSGSLTLSRRFTYYDTGTVNTSTDAGTTTSGGANITTYNYGTGSCGNSFPVSISEPLSLSRSMTWDCNGGVSTSGTDENGKVAKIIYFDTLKAPSSDFLWRPIYSLDALSNETDFAYTSPTSGPPAVPASRKSSMAFNGTTSVVESLSTMDNLGRPYLSQRRQGPGASNYDSVQTNFDAAGRPYQSTMPFMSTAGAGSLTASVVTNTYDALNRTTNTTDAGGGTLSFTFLANDVVQTVGPAPTGENTKKKQLEYDALGRLTSVCEITGATGSGTCGQNTSPQSTGFWTKYTYDALGDLTGVTQNAQAAGASQQTRSYFYDMLGRLTSETNPEAGTVTYAYDKLTSDPSCGSVTSPGDMLKKVDAIGNVTCFQYDGLHRATSVTYPTGTYSASTPTKKFVYDSATVNSTAMCNAKTRLAEAYTCTGACSAKITDLGFSYSARGETTDVWESTPHSSGYYHLTASYWAHGALDSLTGMTGVPTIFYGASDGSGLDGEGRVTKVTASTGTNPVTGVTYTSSGTSQPIGSLTQATYGSLDSDNFSFDPSTGRLTQYKFNVGTAPQTDIGNLTWNANGTLQQLAITDGLNTANSQTCNHGYDDLARAASVNCGAPWSQTFSLDPFGNLSKSGTSNFAAGYVLTGGGTNNRIQSLPGVTVTYDANGNLTSDGTHSHSWDSSGNAIGVDTVSFTYDALNRAVEQGNGSAFTEIVYAPTGGKIALMNSTTLVKAFVSLPGGGTAVYNGSGLQFFRHSDHLGSSRLATTTSRTLFFDGAYAPYGEDYVKTGTTDLSFTGQNQDAVSGIYDFMFRKYNPVHGRWISPDPAGMGAANPANPQSWNRYTYVSNNPLALTDPLGLCDNQSGGAACGDGDHGDQGAPSDALFWFGSSHDGPGSLADSMAADVGAAAFGQISVEAVLNNPFDSDFFSPFDLQFSLTLNGKEFPQKTFNTWGQYADWQTSMSGIPYSVRLVGPWADPNGLTGDATGEGGFEGTFWNYEVVDSQGHPIKGHGTMGEHLETLYSDSGDPSETQWRIDYSKGFHDTIGVVGTFTASTNLTYIGTQQFWATSNHVMYPLTTEVLQINIVQDGQLIASMPIIIKP
jgi:RHS repeat-associated protein